MRRQLPALLAGMLCAALTACGGLDTSSPVQPGLEVGAAQANPVRVVPPGPAAGSSPEEIVSGFLRAGAASDDEFSIARSFLDPGPDSTWRPDTSIMVYTDESMLSVRPLKDGRVRAEAKVVASIDSSGRYQDLPTGSTVDATFALDRSSGEWRIDSVPTTFGLWLSSSDLERLYQPFNVFYVSTASRQLIPDVRWFALGNGLATRLARAQLAPVPDYLEGAVSTDVPAGAHLTVDAVPIDHGVATVDLTATPSGGDPNRRINLWAQFVATLTQAPDVLRVSLRAEGTDLKVPGMESPPSSLADLDYPAVPSLPGVQPVLRSGSRLRHIDPDQVGDSTKPRRPGSDGADLPAVAPGWMELAMSKAGDEFAAVGGDRNELARWRGATRITVPYFASRLTAPRYDLQDMLWVGGLDENGHGGVWVVNSAARPDDAARATPRRLDAPWLTGRRVVGIRVSPDGQRIVVISTDPAGKAPHLDVAGVVRQSNGIPKGLASPLRVAATLTLARDAVWTDAGTLAVLGRISPTDAVRPWLVRVGGEMTALTDAPGAWAITTTSGERGLVLVTDHQTVLARAGSSWITLGEGSDFAVPAR